MTILTSDNFSDLFLSGKLVYNYHCQHCKSIIKWSSNDITIEERNFIGLPTKFGHKVKEIIQCLAGKSYHTCDDGYYGRLIEEYIEVI